MSIYTLNAQINSYTLERVPGTKSTYHITTEGEQQMSLIVMIRSPDPAVVEKFCKVIDSHPPLTMRFDFHDILGVGNNEHDQ